VVAPTAEEADALDTPLYVLGLARGKALQARHPGCEALFVEAGARPGEYHVTATKGLHFLPSPSPTSH
jgi:thiamine biosynthesis lipoprotein ApbE